MLLDAIPLDKVSTSMTINATASTLLAMYIVVAEERGIAARQAERHDPERHPQGVHRARHVHLSARAEPGAHRGGVSLLRRRSAELESDLDLRLPHSRGRRDRGAGAGVHVRQRDRVRRTRAVDAGLDRRRRSRRGSRSSSPRTTTCSRRSRSFAPRVGCTRASCASDSTRATRAAGCAFTRRRAASRFRRSSR